jgi:aryl-alcohol dehydrogenase-like predicted oxidoreductase
VKPIQERVEQGLTTLGRTGLDVSVAGLGCGGHSRLGLANGASEDEAVAVVHRALDLGINVIDTARAYGTEEVVGRALAKRRDEVILSTKAIPEVNGELLTTDRLRGSVEKSLGRLRTDHIDLFFVHGMGVRHLEHCREVLAPELARLREEGKIGFVAASEAFASDTTHQALTTALDAGDDWFDVAMVGFNLLNPSARARLFAGTQARGIGVLVMFAVRRALSDPEACRAVIADLVSEGAVDPATVADRDDPLGFLVHPDGGASVIDAAYRFARHEPGCDVVLTGTGSVAHLEQNVHSITSGPLPEGDLERLRAMFGAVDSVSGN